MGLAMEVIAEYACYDLISNLKKIPLLHALTSSSHLHSCCGVYCIGLQECQRQTQVVAFNNGGYCGAVGVRSKPECPVACVL